MTGRIRPDPLRLCLSAVLLYGCLCAAAFFATSTPPWHDAQAATIHAGHVHAVALAPLAAMFLTDLVRELLLIRRPKHQRSSRSTHPPARHKAPRGVPVRHG